MKGLTILMPILRLTLVKVERWLCFQLGSKTSWYNSSTEWLIFYLSDSGRLPDSNELLTKEETVRLKRCIYAAQRKSPPPITTHNVQDDNNDPVLNALRRCQLFNNPEDRVKVGGMVLELQSALWLYLLLTHLSCSNIVFILFVDILEYLCTMHLYNSIFSLLFIVSLFQPCLPTLYKHLLFFCGCNSFSHCPVTHIFHVTGDIPSRVFVCDKPSVWNGLWRVCERLPYGCVSFLLRAMGLHSCWVYCHGYTLSHYQSLR